MGSYLDAILHLSPWLVMAVLGTLVFVEDAIFVGFLVPGETAAVLAGVGAGIDHLSLLVALLVVTAAAIMGDSVGYEVGRHFFGPKVLQTRLLRRHRHRIVKGQEYLRSRGGAAVFFGRFTAFLRAMVPALAGASGMPYRRFVAWNALGGVVWASAYVLLGYLAGSSYHLVEQRVSRGVALALVGMVVVVLIAWRVRRGRQESAAEAEASQEAVAPRP